ncbi:MAG: hypothetical protein J7K36_05355 [Archaeoglobaceae archaeon]|nr:hypothetical protein [Archaeoglobaceae archaeon]
MSKFKVVKIEGELKWDDDLVELVNRPKKFVPRIKYKRPSKTYYTLSSTEKAEKNKPKHVVNLDKEVLDLIRLE